MRWCNIHIWQEGYGWNCSTSSLSLLLSLSSVEHCSLFSSCFKRSSALIVVLMLITIPILILVVVNNTLVILILILIIILNFILIILILNLILNLILILFIVPGRLLYWFGMELLRRNPSPEARGNTIERLEVGIIGSDLENNSTGSKWMKGGWMVI